MPCIGKIAELFLVGICRMGVRTDMGNEIYAVYRMSYVN